MMETLHSDQDSFSRALATAGHRLWEARFGPGQTNNRESVLTLECNQSCACVWSGEDAQCFCFEMTAKNKWRRSSFSFLLLKANVVT